MLLFWQDTIVLILAFVCGGYLLIDKLLYGKFLHLGWKDIVILLWMVLMLLYSYRNPSKLPQLFSLFFIAWSIGKYSNVRWIWILWAALFVICIYSAIAQLASPHFTRLYGFDGNPGIFANTLLPFFGILVSGFLYAKNKIRRYVALLLVLSVALMLALTQSRAAWLGGLAAAVFLACYSTPILSFLKKRTKSQLLSFTTVAAGIAILLFLLLYGMRSDSANGRLLIYKVSAKAVLDTPLGRGLGSFRADYTQLQGEYFSLHPDDKSAILADDSKNAFCDMLQLGFEMGWGGMSLFLISAFLLLKIPISKEYRAEMLGLKAALISFLVASFFSYPLYQWLPSIQLSIIAGMLLSYGKRSLLKVRVSLYGAIAYGALLLVLVLFTAVRQNKQYDSYVCWSKLIVQKSTEQNKADLLQGYSYLMKGLPHNGVVKYNYGITLFELGEYEESIIALNKALLNYSELNLWMCLAESYRALKCYDKSVAYFSRAYYMAPKRFMPLYKLMLVSKESGNIERAKRYALQILNKAVKIPSITIVSIKQEAQTFLSEN